MRWIVNVATSYLKFGIGMLTVFLMTPYIVSVVGIEAFGLWSLAFALVAFLGLFDLGLATAAVKHVAEASANGRVRERNETLATLLLTYGCIGVACAVAMAALVAGAERWFSLDAAANREFRALLLVLGGAVSVLFPLSLFKAVLTGEGRMHVVNVVESVSVLATAALGVLTLNAGWGLTGLALGTGSVMVSSALALVPLAYRTVPALSLSPRLWRPERVRKLLSFSCCVFLASAATLVLLRIDALVIEAFLPLSAVAVYAVAAKIAEYAFLLNKQFSNALMPLVARSRGRSDTATVRRVLTDGTRYQLVIATPIAVVLAWYASDVVAIWLGPDFAEAGPLLAILAGSVWFAAIQMNPANVLGMSGRHRSVAAVMVLCAGVNVALSVALIVSAGLPGVALATLVSVATVQTGVLVPSACRQVGVSLSAFLREVLWPLGPALLLAVAALALLDRLGPPASIAGLAARSAVVGLVFLMAFACTGTTSSERLHTRRVFRQLVSAVQLRPAPR